MSPISDLATTTGFKAAWSITGLMPERVAHRLYQDAADRAVRKNGAGVRQLRANLARVLWHRDGTIDERELETLVKANMRSHMRYWCDAFRLNRMTSEDIAAKITLHGQWVIEQAQTRQTGLLIIGPHSGSRDLAAAHVAHELGGITTVAERVKPESLFKEFTKHREKHKITIIPHGTTTALDQLRGVLDRGGVVVLAGDRDISRRGVTVNLAGQAASLPAGPAILALDTRALVTVVDPYYDEHGHAHAKLRDPISVTKTGSDRETLIKNATQTIADEMTDVIKTHPADWHMMQPVWLADLDDRRL